MTVVISCPMASLSSNVPRVPSAQRGPNCSYGRRKVVESITTGCLGYRRGKPGQDELRNISEDSIACVRLSNGGDGGLPC